jgi:peptide deformylase
MTVRRILLYPQDERLLRRKSVKVKKIDKSIRQLIKDLKETLDDHGGGAGLAAPQIGVPLRVTIVRFGQDDEDMQPPLALINPEITLAGTLQKGFDGCLSVPGLETWDTLRPDPLEFSALDETGKKIKQELVGMDARLVHHEIDHLDGILFLDRVQDLHELYKLVQTEEGEKLVSMAELASDVEIGRMSKRRT